VRAIFTALKEEQMSSSEPVKQWTQQTLAHLQTRCPTALVVSLAHIRRCGSLTLGQCFDHDFSLVQKLIIRSDFCHGVHTITHGSKAGGSEFGWQPATIEEIEDEHAIVCGFLYTPPTRPLHLVCGISTSVAPDFTEYPYRQYMLPSEHDVKGILEASTERHTSRTSGLDFILSHLSGKHGIREKVLEVLDRKTKTIDGALKWID
jgi:3-hydroxyisobutyryl-CoA hydrolase